MSTHPVDAWIIRKMRIFNNPRIWAELLKQFGPLFDSILANGFLISWRRGEKATRSVGEKLAKWMREQMTSHVGRAAMPKNWEHQNRQWFHGGGQRSTSWLSFVRLASVLTMKTCWNEQFLALNSSRSRGARFREVSELVSSIRQRTGLLIASAVPIFGFRRIVRFGGLATRHATTCIIYRLIYVIMIVIIIVIIIIMIIYNNIIYLYRSIPVYPSLPVRYVYIYIYLGPNSQSPIYPVAGLLVSNLSGSKNIGGWKIWAQGFQISHMWFLNCVVGWMSIKWC